MPAASSSAAPGCDGSGCDGSAAEPNWCTRPLSRYVAHAVSEESSTTLKVRPERAWDGRGPLHGLCHVHAVRRPPPVRFLARVVDHHPDPGLPPPRPAPAPAPLRAGPPRQPRGTSQRPTCSVTGARPVPAVTARDPRADRGRVRRPHARCVIRARRRILGLRRRRLLAWPDSPSTTACGSNSAATPRSRSCLPPCPVPAVDRGRARPPLPPGPAPTTAPSQPVGPCATQTAADPRPAARRPAQVISGLGDVLARNPLSAVVFGGLSVVPPAARNCPPGWFAIPRGPGPLPGRAARRSRSGSTLPTSGPPAPPTPRPPDCRFPAVTPFLRS